MTMGAMDCSTYAEAKAAVEKECEGLMLEAGGNEHVLYQFENIFFRGFLRGMEVLVRTERDPENLVELMRELTAVKRRMRETFERLSLLEAAEGGRT